MRSAGNYELLIGKIDTFIRKYYFNNLLRGLIFLGAGLFSAYIIITLSEYYGDFNSSFRTFLFYFFIFLNLGLIAWLVIPSLMAWLRLGQTITHDQAAEIIGKHFSDVSDKLLNTLQLKKLADSSQHRELIEASIDQKIETLKPVSFPSAVNLRENTKYLKWLIFPAAVICIIALAAPSILTESTKKLIRHNEYFAPVAPFKFVLLNNSLSAVQGQDLKVDLKLEGDKLPADVYIEIGNNTFKLDKENISRFHYQFSNLQKNTSFKFSGNGFSSQEYAIKVNLKPSLLHFDVDLDYPAYLHRHPEHILNAGDLTIPTGTLVKWELHTQNADGIQFDINDNHSEATSVGTDAFSHSERIYKNSIYKLNPISKSVSHGDSASYRINVIPDELPTITVNEKNDSISSKALYFDGKITDDHGFSSLTFNYKIGAPGDKNGAKVTSKSVKADLSKTQADFFYFWNLKDMGVKPGEQITYYFEVADNDGVAGPKKVRSTEKTLNIPDQKEVNEQLDKSTQVVKQKMQDAIKLAGQIEHDSQKLNQMLLDKNTLSFDEKKQIDELLDKKKDLDNLIKDIQDENKKNLYERQENQEQNKELQDKEKQIENLFNNVLDQKTRDLLEKLQRMMDQQQKDGTRDQLSKMQMDNKSLKKELDRILQLYKKLEFDQKLDQNISQLNQLSDKQEKLSEQTQQKNVTQQDLQQQQQKLQQDFQDVKKSLEDLQKQDESSEQKNNFQNPKEDEQSIDQQMQQSSQSLQKNDRQNASKSQQQSSKQMKQLASKLQQQQEQQEDTQNNVDAQQLRELLKNLVNSSFDQEKVMETLKNTTPTDPNYTILAQKQKDIKDNLKTAEDSLYSLSRRVPQIQSTVNREIASINDHIDRTLENLSDRRTPEASRNQQYAMTSMNNLALMLSEALDQLQNAMKNAKGGGGKSKQPSLSQLNRMQQQLNQNMQKMRDQLQKQGNMSQSQRSGMSEQLAKMAREQQMIREALDKINQQENKDGTGKLGNLDKISKEMEQTENDIVNRRITDDLLKRQQQIQSRLLEAEKAERQQEQDQQRESNAGKDLPPGYIKALQDYQKLSEKQTEQIKTVSPALNLYYKQKIKSYFDQLNAH